MCPGGAAKRDDPARRLRWWWFAVKQAVACGDAASLVRKVVEDESGVDNSLASERRDSAGVDYHRAGHLTDSSDSAFSKGVERRSAGRAESLPDAFLPAKLLDLKVLLEVSSK